MENTALWDSLAKTPLEHTKAITGKPYKGTSPKPYWLIRRATEVFGPIGIAWGFTIVEEKLLDGAMTEKGFPARIHMARVRVWYEWNNKRGEVEHVGQTEFCGVRNSGQAFTDEDAPKKSVTDALTKALSMIGFAGDIFMGRYDDSKYVDDLKQEAKAEKAAADKPADKAASKKPTLDQRYKALSQALDLCKTAPDLDKTWKRASELLDELHINDPEKYNALRDVYDLIKNRFPEDPFSDEKKAA